MYSFGSQEVDSDDDLYINDALITDDGKYLVFVLNKTIEGKEQTGEESILISWDITASKFVLYL